MAFRGWRGVEEKVILREDWVSGGWASALCVWRTVTVDVDYGQLHGPEEANLAPLSTQTALSDREERRCGSGRGGR